MVILAVLVLLGQEPLSQAEFSKLHQDLQPPSGELWRTIPWNTSLIDASQKAAREAKPLFVWAMHGHPLGTC